ncbi:VOC family protein [Roseateles sp. DAIF2]|uniref:VOC family protein n=1 Tax=Roseateles sp. DAIF2 TaxID=2714952 RepID=UPI0018A32ABF|nr:VOC family protein [Roseateles sp. DAIF2]QPF75249.1 VOC family protein [Roseateles sp. DAIF2]
MISYVTLGSNALPAARAFYTAVLAPLGLVPGYANDHIAGFGPEGKPQLWVCAPYDGNKACIGNGSMLALDATSRAQVDAVHAAALAAGGTSEGAPGLRDYGPNFYACYFRDLDGNKLAVVCRAAEG